MLKLIPLAAYLYTLLVIIASLAKFVISFMQGSGVENGDKYAHTLAYFGFAIIWALFFYIKNGILLPNRHDFRKAIYKAAIFGIAFGILMEFAQLTLTNYRSFEVADAIANSLGVVIASVFMYSFANFLSLVKKRGL